MWEMLDRRVSISVSTIGTGILTWGLPCNSIYYSKRGFGQSLGHRVTIAKPRVRFCFLFHSQHVELSISHLAPQPPPGGCQPPDERSQVWCPHASLADRHPSCPVVPGRVGDNINELVFKWRQRECFAFSPRRAGQPMASFSSKFPHIPGNGDGAFEYVLNWCVFLAI